VSAKPGVETVVSARPHGKDARLNFQACGTRDFRSQPPVKGPPPRPSHAHESGGNLAWSPPLLSEDRTPKDISNSSGQRFHQPRIFFLVPFVSMDFLRNPGFTMRTPPAPLGSKAEARSLAGSLQNQQVPHLVCFVWLPYGNRRLPRSTHSGVTCHAHSRRVSAVLPGALRRSALTTGNRVLIPHFKWLTGALERQLKEKASRRLPSNFLADGIGQRLCLVPKVPRNQEALKQSASALQAHRITRLKVGLLYVADLLQWDV
jgi:hypothetical protein